MAFASSAYGLVRLATGVRSFVRTPITAEAAAARIRDDMRCRDARFLSKVERGVFASASSPYLKLFRLAGCGLEDLREMVARDGIEGALAALYAAGVYVTFEEFKGRRPIVRGSQTLSVRPADFDNPVVVPHFQSTSGGTRGRPTRILIDLDHIEQSAPHWALWFAAHDVGDRPLWFWTPAHAGIANRLLLAAKCGKRYERWFTDVKMVSVKDRTIAPIVHWLVRHATGSPPPEFMPISEAAKVGRLLADMAAQGRPPCLITSPSEAVRACLAMQEQNVSLAGVTFLLGAEPLTQSRRDTIEASGARAIPTYGFSEGGSVGSQCPSPSAADDIHISLDAYAIIQRPPAAGAVSDAGALLLTALRPASPKVLLNTEIGDSAVLDTRRCDCLFDAVGYRQHLHTIRSFEKITGFGVTFVAADLYHVLEGVLPKRFGGAATDYQLVEAQDARGLPRYTLFVDPALGPLDSTIVAAVFLEELGRLANHYRYMVNLWDQVDVLTIARERPRQTTRGKTLPFRTLGPS